VYHTDGIDVATLGLELGLSSEYWRSRGLSKAKIARELLSNYVNRAEPDKRVAVPASPHTVHWGAHQISANVDVLIRDRRGHVGRLCFTGNVGRPLSRAELALIAAAPLRGLLDEFEGQLFGDIIAEIEVWELRLDIATVIPRDEASQAWDALLVHLTRATAQDS
jgi:hypothetical protein